MALSCAAIRRDSVSLLKFPFLSLVQFFWWEMLFISRDGIIITIIINNNNNKLEMLLETLWVGLNYYY